MVRKFNMEIIHEEIVSFSDNGSLSGIFASGKRGNTNNKTCAIFLNAGLIHKIGPNRIYKKLSENYAENGFNTFRFDFSGLGDSEFSNKKASNDNVYFKEIEMAMNWIQVNKGIDRFLLSGICSGARLAFFAALKDSRVIGLSLIDGVYADDDLLKEVGGKAKQNTVIRYYKKNIFNLERWVKLLSGGSKLLKLKNITYLIKQLGRIVASEGVAENEFKKKNDFYQAQLSNPLCATPWRMLVDRGVKIQLIFCEGGVAIDIYNLTLEKHLNEYRKRGELQTMLVKDVDHTFTPIWAQTYLLNLTVTWLKNEFGEDQLQTKADLALK